MRTPNRKVFTNKPLSVPDGNAPTRWNSNREFRLPFKGLSAILTLHSRFGYNQVQHTTHPRLKEFPTEILEVREGVAVGPHKPSRGPGTIVISSGTSRTEHWKRDSWVKANGIE